MPPLATRTVPSGHLATSWCGAEPRYQLQPQLSLAIQQGLQQKRRRPAAMAYWWVNHKQTYRQETDGGYIWSPKANANGARNVSYDNLTRCQRGDVVFSYANGRISQIGLVETAAVTAPKPPEFGTAGDNWSQEGWLVRVNWQPLRQPLVPQTFFELLQPLLPERHSPISTSTGRGNQVVYLAGLSETLGLMLLKLIEDHADPAVRVHLVVLAEEGAYTAALLDDMQRLREVPSSTERDALTNARLGQGLFEVVWFFWTGPIVNL
jgi:putative restriction endonuclease